MGEMKHSLHEHKLILNEAEPVVGKDAECVGCREPINKLIDAFYTCTTALVNGSPLSDCVGFFMHKTCAELPSTFTHPMKPQRPLSLLARPDTVRPYKKQLFCKCGACEGFSQGFMYGSHNHDFLVCLKCVSSELKSLEDRGYCHQGHNHPLALVQSPALFLCHACNTTATDLSYICTKCCFWIHKSCANAPITYQSKFHKEHSLILHYSLPEEYSKFVSYCSICNKNLNRIYWVYICANCRFFAHVKCASSTEMLSENEMNDEAHCGESNLMHFPAHDEASLYEMMQHCIMNTSAIAEEASPYINHWAHEHQQLALRNKNTMTPDNCKLANTELLICDGCTKPISLTEDIFYECNSCKFFLHRSCAQYPQQIEHHLAGKLEGVLLTQDIDKLAALRCQGCGIAGNGIFMCNETAYFDIGCASLPKMIKHDAHRHPLNQLKYPDDFVCKACLREKVSDRETIMYGCEKCEFYVHIQCALRPHLVKHRWDPHPLYLILFPKDVSDHPHEYQCEFCSEEIDPATWFYHCNVCDESFHTFCVDPYDFVANMKFGATNIYSSLHPHSHGLTLVLNKKKRSCNMCGKDAWGVPLLECSSCKFIMHMLCE